MSTQTHQRSDICGMRDRNLENLDRSFNSCQSKVKKLHPSMDSPRIGTITKAKSTTRMQNTVNVFFTSSVWCESTVSKTKFLKATNCIWPRLVPPLPKPTKAAMIRAKSKFPRRLWHVVLLEVRGLSNCVLVFPCLLESPSKNMQPNILRNEHHYARWKGAKRTKTRKLCLI